jgi:hypothetical protein
MSRPSEGSDAAGLTERALARLCEATALIVMIEDRDLLGELPAGDTARANHQAGVSMLSILRRELEGVAVELEAAIHTREVLDRLRTPRSAR